MFYISQTSQNDCGFACLKMLLATLHEDRNYLYLPNREKDRPLSYARISDLAKKYGVELLGIKVEEKEEIRKNDRFPFLVTLKSSEEVSHAVLVTQLTRHRVKIMDPNRGTYSLSYKMFYALWDGTGLLVNHYEKTRCPQVYQEERKPKDYVGSILCQVMSVICCILGVYFMDERVNLFIPIALFALGALFEVMLRAGLFKFMRKMDETYLEDLKLDKRQYREFHTRFEDYKKTVLLTPMNAAWLLFTSAFLIFIVIFNDIHNVLMVFIPIILSLVEVFYVHPSIKEKENEIGILEKELFQSEDMEMYKDKEEEIHERAYRLARLTLVKKYAAIILMLLVTILVMALSKVISLPYIVFYLCIEYTLFTNLVNLFTYGEKKRDYLNAKVRLNDILHQNDEII